jgi:hypothetical protein
MDLRAYYRKVRAVEAELEGDDIVLASLATPEGGRDGVFTEAPRMVAAKLVAEGRARVADKAEAQSFREQLRLAKEKADQEEAARRVQVMVIPTHEIRKTKDRS